MSIWHELRCDQGLPQCLSNKNDGPAGFNRAYMLERAKKTGWKVTNGGGDAICPACFATMQLKNYLAELKQP